MGDGGGGLLRRFSVLRGRKAEVRGYTESRTSVGSAAAECALGVESGCGLGSVGGMGAHKLLEQADRQVAVANHQAPNQSLIPFRSTSPPFRHKNV